MGVLVIVFAAAHVLLSRSRLGWHITAVGASRRAARHAGIDVERVLMTSYVLSGMLCAGAALFYASRLDSSSSRTGEGMELGALTAVVLGGISLSGGKGTAARALIGASVVTLLGKGLLLMNVTGSIYSTLLAAVLLVAVGADVKWAKNRGKTIQKIYVNPTIIESGVLPDISAGSVSPYAQNTRLRDAEAIGLGQVEGPEDVICDEEGIPVFDRLRYGRQPQTEAVLFAFDLLELSGEDLRRTPLEERKRTLAKLLRKYGPDEFESLAKQLRSADLTDALCRVIGETASAGRRINQDGSEIELD